VLFKSRVLDKLLHLASTSRSRSAITLAAVSFAICHFVAIATMPAPAVVANDLDAEIPRQLIHFAAVFLRFALPLSVMVVGMIRLQFKAASSRSVEQYRVESTRSGRPLDNSERD
jgi:hypothetical protein